MVRCLARALCLFVATILLPRVAHATRSAELYSAASYGYGRVEARIRFAAGDGVVGSFFLWKDGSEMPGTFWNELDYEKIGADCRLVTNAFYGNPAAVHNQYPMLTADPCGEFHVYAYEWTPDALAWFFDGTEVRRETGDAAAAYANNATGGMQIRFNIWPGDSSFGGNFDPSILPVHEYVDWIQYSSYANGAFTVAWREDFDAATTPAGWQAGSWSSPKNLSTHDARNVNFVHGYAVLSLTAEDATGPAGAVPEPGAVPDAGSQPEATAGASDEGGCSIGGSRPIGTPGVVAALSLLALVAARRRRT